LEGATQRDREKEKGDENLAEIEECKTDEKPEREKEIVKEDDGETRKGQQEKV